MSKKVGTKRYDQKVVNTIILVIVLALLVYLGIQISRGFSSKVSTQRTQIATESGYAYLDGCIFRNDIPVTESGDVVYYTVQNGEKVGVGQTYAVIYSNTGLSADECREKSARLMELSLAISLLENGLKTQSSSSQLGAVNDSIDSGYYSYIDSILAGDFKAADEAGDRLLSGLVSYSAIVEGEAARDRLSLLKTERDDILSSLGGNKKTLVSEESFNFFYTADGYEKSLHASAIEDLSPSKLQSLMSNAPKTSDDVIGKMTVNSKWYLAIPTDNASLAIFEERVGGALTVDFLNYEGLEISMLLEGVFSDAEGDGAYILLSSHSLAHIAFADRFQSVGILLDSCTGYRVPAEAMHSVDGQDGVYVLVGSVIEFRRVTVLTRNQDYCIVASYEADHATNGDNEIPYLNINDMIVTSGNDLYDGKQLD